MDISQLITNMKFKCLQSMKDKKKKKLTYIAGVVCKSVGKS